MNKAVNERIEQIAVDMAVVKEKTTAIEAHLKRLNGSLDKADTRIVDLDRRLSTIRTAGLTLASVWTVLATIAGIWAGFF